MNDDAIKPVELRHIYDKDFKTHMAMGTGTTFTNNRYIHLDFFVDEPPVDDAILEQNASGNAAQIIDRKIMVRVILEKDTALMLANKLTQMHRIMSGPMPEE